MSSGIYIYRNTSRLKESQADVYLLATLMITLETEELLKMFNDN